MIQIPKHVAIVMDGNGRWAKRRGHPRVFGHVRGSTRVKSVVREADRLGVKALTLFAFSTENWSRPEGELRVLWKLLVKYLIREADELDRENVRLCVIGELERLPANVREVLLKTEARLSGNTGLVLTFAVSYGARAELARAAQLFAQDCMAGKTRPEQMNEDFLARYLWTRELGELAEVDLVIRTSGEKRTSNFLLWQAAYAEYVFMDLCWPDFRTQDFRNAVEEFSNRERRYGGVSVTALAAAAHAPVSSVAVS